MLVGGLQRIQHREIHAGADQHEKHGGEQGHQRLDRCLNRLSVLGATEDQTGGEGPQSRLQADRLGQEAAEREHHETGHHHLARGLEVIEHPVEQRCGGAAEKQGRGHKQNRRHHQLHNRPWREPLATGQGHHHRQDDDAENVIEHGGTDHDLALAAAQPAQFTENAGGDADAGGGHGRTGKDRQDQRHLEQQHQAGGAQGEGQQHTRHRHRGGL